MLRRLTRAMLALVAVILLATAAPGQSEVNIEETNRVANVGNGYCAWCSLETLGRHHGIKVLEGLVKHRQERRFYDDKTGKWVENGGAYVPDDLAKELDRLKLKYLRQERGDKKTELLKRACGQKLGCVVGMRDYPGQGDSHAVTVVGWGDEVTFIDPNYTDQIRQASQDWFLRKWSGGVIVLVVDTPVDGPPPAYRPLEYRAQLNDSIQGYGYRPSTGVGSGVIIKPQRIPPTR